MADNDNANTTHTSEQINSSTAQKGGNLNGTIQIYLRLRPCRDGSHQHDHINIAENQKSIDIRVPVEDQGYVNNTIRKHTFKFDKIFDTKTTQEQMFDDVAKDVIDSTLDGYNGTIFAYGQTGSGKTYTITGGVESINSRGIIPRTLSYIFSEIKKRTNQMWKVYVSYLEIYNNDGYDLLYDSNERKYELESLPRVRIRENQNKQLILTNLSIHQIDNFQEGMSLLMLGDDNRVVAETPKNDASTRSHCLFMIQIESQKIGEDSKILSKLHIVDLSGSEKPSKTNLSGVRMTEALNINISLFYLESVIIEINNHSKYIPYRNSMMTMCLRDSIGGNCKTRMIANLSSDFEDVLESLSTCRFAQRVALVKNSAVVNEVVDPGVLIQKQKSEIEELKNELAMLKGQNQKDFLEQADIEDCEKIVDEFLGDDTYTKKIELNDRLMIQECFNIIKKRYKTLEKKSQINNGEIVLNGNQDLDKVIALENENKQLNAEIAKLKDMLKSREEEMKILLEKMENTRGEHKTLVARLNQEENEAINKMKNNILGDLVKFDNLTNANASRLENNLNDSISQVSKNSKAISTSTTKSQSVQIPQQLLKDINTANSYTKGVPESQVTLSLLKDRKSAYLFFKKYYYAAEVEKENQSKIKEKMLNGKKLSEEYKKLEAKMEGIKKQIEETRKNKILDKEKEALYTKQENELMEQFSSLRPVRKKQQEDLKSLRNDIQTMQTIDSNYQIGRTKHFEFWYEVMIKKLDFESKNGKINMSTGMADSSAPTSNYGSSRGGENSVLNGSSISHATELNERLSKKVEMFKSNMNN